MRLNQEFKQGYMNWLDLNEYPFEHKYFHSAHGKIHYIDEGEGESIVFVHGTPTWSFLYRNYIKSLSSKYRCLAIDHLGFGLSDKPNDFAGTPEAHAKNFSSWVNALKLEKFTLVVHDFGGPIALSYTIDHPEKISSIVMFNTWLWETKNNKDVVKIDKILHSTIGNYLYLNTNFSPRYLFKKAFFDHKKLTSHIHQHYKKPYKSRHDRYGLLKLGKSLKGSSDWYEEQWKQISSIKNIPFLILWGVKDQFIKKEELIRWKNVLKNAKIIEYNCGHFVQEETFEDSIKPFSEFLENKLED
jgi:pimeloyl-ACP methyl ester carboxylesterase